MLAFDTVCLVKGSQTHTGCTAHSAQATVQLYMHLQGSYSFVKTCCSMSISETEHCMGALHGSSRASC